MGWNTYTYTHNFRHIRIGSLKDCFYVLTACTCFLRDATFDEFAVAVSGKLTRYP